MRGWWRVHHAISTFAGGVLLIWPNGVCYQKFRYQMMCFNVYVAFLQYLQFTYQRGVLYRLRSLGQLLIHTADPQSRSVVIVVFAHVVRP